MHPAMKRLRNMILPCNGMNLSLMFTLMLVNYTDTLLKEGLKTHEICIPY